MAASQSLHVPSFLVGLVHAGLGDGDRALEWLEKAREERAHWLVFLDVDPRLDCLRAESGFNRLRDRIGLGRGPR